MFTDVCVRQAPDGATGPGALHGACARFHVPPVLRQRVPFALPVSKHRHSYTWALRRRDTHTHTHPHLPLVCYAPCQLCPCRSCFLSLRSSTNTHLNPSCRLFFLPVVVAALSLCVFCTPCPHLPSPNYVWLCMYVCVLVCVCLSITQRSCAFCRAASTWLPPTIFSILVLSFPRRTASRSCGLIAVMMTREIRG